MQSHTLDSMRKALADFTHPYFHEYHDEFLAGPYLDYLPLKQPSFAAHTVVASFAHWCESLGYWRTM